MTLDSDAQPSNSKPAADQRKAQAQPQPAYYLAFDHRGEFRRSLSGLGLDQGDGKMAAAVVAAKLLIAEACLALVADAAVPRAVFGALVDEEYGADAARRLKAAGIPIAMPVETADAAVFDFAFGPAFADHIEAFDPDYVKVLIRYNVEENAATNAIQRARLSVLQEWLDKAGRRLLFELVVRPTPAQSAACAEEGRDFVRHLRPELALRAMTELQADGIAPHLWKVEGIDDPALADLLGMQASFGVARREASCIVLGSGLSLERVGHWLSVAASARGYRGFAIGRTIWKDPIRTHLSGQASEDDVISGIAMRFRDCVDRYEAAVGSASRAQPYRGSGEGLA